MSPAEVLRRAAELAAKGRSRFPIESARIEAKIYYPSEEFLYLDTLIKDCGYFDATNTNEDVIALLLAAHLAEEEQ